MKLRIALPLFILFVAPAWLCAQDKEVQVERDLVYGKGGTTELKLNLAMPKEGEGPFPAIVCIHGGGWSAAGAKAQ